MYSLGGYATGSLPPFASYAEGRYLFMKTLDTVSANSGASLDVVREAFVRAYFSKIGMESIRNNLKEICEADVAEGIKNPDLISLARDLDDFREMDTINRAKGLESAYLLKAVSNYLLRSLA
jgi:hypothetical protein